MVKKLALDYQLVSEKARIWIQEGLTPKLVYFPICTMEIWLIIEIIQSLSSPMQKLGKSSLRRRPNKNLALTAECRSQQEALCWAKKVHYGWTNVSREGRGCNSEANPWHIGCWVEGQSITFRLCQMVYVRLIPLPAPIRAHSATSKKYSSSSRNIQKRQKMVKKKITVLSNLDIYLLPSDTRYFFYLFYLPVPDLVHMSADIQYCTIQGVLVTWFPQNSIVHNLNNHTQWFLPRSNSSSTTYLRLSS